MLGEMKGPGRVRAGCWDTPCAMGGAGGPLPGLRCSFETIAQAGRLRSLEGQRALPLMAYYFHLEIWRGRF